MACKQRSQTKMAQTNIRPIGAIIWLDQKYENEKDIMIWIIKIQVKV